MFVLMNCLVSSRVDLSRCNPGLSATRLHPLMVVYCVLSIRPRPDSAFLHDTRGTTGLFISVFSALFLHTPHRLFSTYSMFRGGALRSSSPNNLTASTRVNELKVIVYVAEPL